mgnify:FL=1
MLGDLWGRILGAALTIAAIAPFLRAMIMKKNRSEEFKSLWSDSRFNHAPLFLIILLRIVIAIGFIVFIIENLFRASAALMVGIAIIVVCAMIFISFP